MIDGRHELVRLAALIDWGWFEREWAGFFPAGEGRPAIHPRLVAGMMYLQHAYSVSDEAVLARWVENPYFQHFTGKTFFQHRLPLHPSSLSRWRSRIGEEGVEWLLSKTIEAARAAGAVPERSLAEIAVDTTVMENTPSPTPSSRSRPSPGPAPALPWSIAATAAMAPTARGRSSMAHVVASRRSGAVRLSRSPAIVFCRKIPKWSHRSGDLGI
jgi:hypothetical protein